MASLSPARFALALIATAASAAAAAQGATRADPDALAVGYFLDWPTPHLVAKADGAYEAALGVPVDWIAFETGTQMTEAFRAGELDLAHAMGLAPFVGAVNESQPLIAVAVSGRYAASDCVVRTGTGIDAGLPRSFEGRRVAVPLTTAADYSFRLMMDALGVDVDAVDVVDRVPSDGAADLVDGEVDMACGFGPLAMAKMYSAGAPLMSDADKEAAGILEFDVIVADERFARARPEAVASFLAVTHAANEAWEGTPEQIRKVGMESGLDAAGVVAQLRGLSFPTVAEQLDDFFGPDGLTRSALDAVGETFAGEGSPPLADYGPTIDASFLR